MIDGKPIVSAVGLFRKFNLDSPLDAQEWYVEEQDGVRKSYISYNGRMVEDGCDCSEVLVQLAAVRSALDNTGKIILQDHMRHCMVDAVAAGDTDAIEELCQAIDKFMK